ncbi:rib72 protein-like protein [Trypanosoma conorhini]|uniref:Rib72 protein-like protein n=1 Tax=Trypanosoma conorhini TaxID=83891 RepID=A0A3R7NZV4_9TRYP|nr:rib72 protein-like protein [Trypanosoma conorhini]RNF14754.1 rib72 protein-like protein [Trypanosoma conorhini]
MEKTVYNALPKLPGFSFAELHPPATHFRRHYCSIRDGTRSVLDAHAARRRGDDDGQGGECGGLSRAEILAKFPEWKSLDDKVLRFFAYYVERVDESMVERMRVRKVKLHFYLRDGTLVVVETPAVVNSGLPAGTIVSRCKIDGVDFFSLYVGSSIRVRGLEYIIVDCDAATRDFCAAMGMTQPEPFGYPEDAFEGSVRVEKAPMDEQHVAMRRAMEVIAATSTGAHATLLSPEERNKARNFFEHDREVLRFLAVWEQRLFRLQYYIADKTISVMLEHARNDGRDPNPVFIRRTLIPKDPKTALRDTETLNVPLGSPVAYITDEDLRTGQTVNLFTRDFYIFDCDPYTREYYEARGIKQPAFPKPPTEADILAPTAKAPPPTTTHLPGIKSVQGASTMVFEDTAGQKDRLKLTRYTNDVFRFGARRVNPSPEDEGRRFLFCYYLADDTVSLFELVVANSGHVGGKCFARSVVPEINEPGKLYVGAKVKLAGATYELTEMDERTKRYLAMGMPNMEESYFHTQELVERVRHVVLNRFSGATDVFRSFKSTSDGLKREDVKRLFLECGTRLDAVELDRVMERLDRDKDGVVSLSELVENLLLQQFVSDFVAKGEARDGIEKGPLRSLRSLEASKAAAREGDEALRRLISQSEARRTLLIRAFRTTSNNTYDGHLSVEDFKWTLRERLNLSLTDREVDALTFKFFYAPGSVNWTARRLPVKEIKRLIMR